MTLRQINFGTHYFSVFFLHVQKWTLSKGPSLACSRHAWMQWWISPHLSNSESDVVWWISLAHQPWKNKLYHPVPSFKTQGVRSSGTLIVHLGPLMVPMAMVLLACGSLKRAWGRTPGPLEEGALSVECFDEVWAEQRDSKNDVFGCWWCCSLGCFLANAFLLAVFVRHVEGGVSSAFQTFSLPKRWTINTWGRKLLPARLFCCYCFKKISRWRGGWSQPGNPFQNLCKPMGKKGYVCRMHLNPGIQQWSPFHAYGSVSDAGDWSAINFQAWWWRSRSCVSKVVLGISLEIRWFEVADVQTSCC